MISFWIEDPRFWTAFFNPNIFSNIFPDRKINYSGIIDKQRPLHFARMRGFSKTGEICSFWLVLSKLYYLWTILIGLTILIIRGLEAGWLWESVRGFEIMANANDNQWQKDAADQNFDYMFKLLIIGNSAVGKTSFLFRYADDSFTSAFVSTVGIDFKVKTVFRNDKRVKLQIWDTG